MTYLLMIGITFGVFSQNICAKQFYKRNQDNSKAIFVYCFIMTLGAFFVATIAMAVQASWNPGTLLYAGIFAICYLCAIIFIALAIQSGPLSLSSLLQSLSLIIPTVYGLIVLQEKLSMLGWIGIICLLISVITTNIYKKGNKPTKCWFVFILLACFGNGLCSVVQKAHQIAYGDMFSTLFMSFAMGIAVIVTGILVLYIEKAKKTNIFKFVHGNIYAGFSGVLNAAVNLSMLFLAAQIPAAILYPTVTAGGIVLAFIVSIFFYKERLSLLQYICYTAGVVAVILLNL